MELRALLPLFLCLTSQTFLHAIPNSFFGNGTFIGPVIPAQPVFGRDLTRDFFEVENWKKGEFPGPWEEQSALEGESVQKMTANPTVLGAVPMSVYAYHGGEAETRELAIHFLDAGQYFGYLAGGEKSHEQRTSGSDRRSEFTRLHRMLTTELRRRLDAGCGRGVMGTIGRSDELRTVYTEYKWQDFVIRLVARSGHSVSVHILKSDHVPDSFYSGQIASLGDREKQAYFAAKVISSENGDRIIDGVPMFTQGNTPFCGIQSLAMAGHYLGLRVHPETLAAGADFLNTGSARGSRILDLYRGIGEEIDMKVQTSSRFSPEKAARSIQAGLPLIVWRRVSKERELEHNRFLQAYQRNPQLELGEPSRKVMELYPARDSKGSPSHASVITGINSGRKEVIFTEPWGDQARNRRMRFEEMEATAYAVFSFSWR